MNSSANLLLSKIPTHIAFIMDGNRRWAHARGLPSLEGHRKGVDSLKLAVEFCAQIGVKHMTMYTFSTENWKRPEAEVMGLMGMLKIVLKREIYELHKNNIKIKFIGNRDGLKKDITELFDQAEALTVDNDRLCLNIAFNYGARSDIVKAAKELSKLSAAGDINPEDIDDNMVAKHLSTNHSPDPDLLIRTAGEQRLSNFLLWEMSYTELVFLDEYWPEINKDLLTKAIKIYQTRERKFGNISASA